jgi:hypothetical protein
VNAGAVAWICEGAVTGWLTFELGSGMVIGGLPQPRSWLRCVEILQIMLSSQLKSQATMMCVVKTYTPHIIALFAFFLVVPIEIVKLSAISGFSNMMIMTLKETLTFPCHIYYLRENNAISSRDGPMMFIVCTKFVKCTTDSVFISETTPDTTTASTTTVATISRSSIVNISPIAALVRRLV